MSNSCKDVEVATAEVETEIRSPEAKPQVTNQQVLMVTTILFGLFVVAEVIGAFAGHSLSLLGDAAAMSVDVFTYITNMYAERIKASGNEINETTRMLLEVYIPTFSICSLLAVTAWITSDAINVILGKDKEEVNVLFLYGFSSANFVVDIASSCMFAYRGGGAFNSVESAGAYQAVPDSEGTEVEISEEEIPSKYITFSDSTSTVLLSGLKSRLNLNMCSALTHLGGDTLRTTSVFIAAIVASTSDAPVNVCDAWAAIIVTFTTVILVIPLIYHICQAACPSRN